ncbi:MAG: aminoglycoside phosphotransferase family protein, partial [Chloroflexota bacterium]|nr:aminoglycoside phosphotransferase family protein [Chloroflexota bacterium]
LQAEPELIRYKPGRKALLRYRLENAPVETMYGKLRSDELAVPLRDQTSALIGAGVPTPPVLFVNTRHRFMAHARAPGKQLASLRGTPEFTGWMEPLAQSLNHLQSVYLQGARVHSLADEIAVIDHTALWLERIAPGLAGRLDQLSDTISARLANMDERTLACHGDFYDDQALVGESGVIIIDLDELKLGHPLLDVGNMLAHLTSGEARGADIGDARDAFLSASLHHSAHCRSDIAVFEAAALLKLAPGPFRRLEPDWPDGIERIVALAEARLADRHARVVSPPRHQHPTGASPAGAAPRGIPASPRRAALAEELTGASTPQCVDPALPQLVDLLSPDVMSQRFTDTFGNGQVSVGGIEVVRHKVGRRAILRYQLDENRQTEVVYGKTFASRRGPKVHAITSAITSARAFGPDIALPEPIAYLPDLKLLAQRPVAGEPIVPDLLDGDTWLAERIATALYRFHTSGLELGRLHDLTKELSPLEMRAEQVGEHAPELRDIAESCLRRIQSDNTANVAWRHTPVHRDFYHDQVLIDDGNLAVLDLDDASMSEPAVDVANFGAHLILLAAQHPEQAANLASVRRSFTGHYRALDHALDGDLLRFLTATTLLRLAGIHVSRSNGEAVARTLITECERWLAGPQRTLMHFDRSGEIGTVL